MEFISDLVGSGMPLVHRVAAPTNLISHPNTFSSWINDTCATIPAQTLAPDFVSLADKVHEDLQDSSRAVFHSLSTTAVEGQALKFDVYAKDAGRHWIAIEMAPQGDFWNFDLLNGVLGSPYDDDDIVKLLPEIVKLGDGWYKCSIINPNITDFGGQGVDTIGIYIEDHDNSEGYQGDGVSGVYLWGASAIIL